MQYPKTIKNLIEQFNKLPGIGTKTSERFVFYLLRKSNEEIKEFANCLLDLKNKTTICQICGAVSETNPCQICSDIKRDKSKICVVAETRDMLAIENLQNYNGVYHILGGVINTTDKINLKTLNIKQLVNRLKNNQIKEVILAFNPNLEGETTILYLTKILKPYNVKITKLAKGLPVGGDIEYADEGTLSSAFKYRNEI